jgi:hypothetical protein
VTRAAHGRAGEPSHAASTSSGGRRAGPRALLAAYRAPLAAFVVHLALVALCTSVAVAWVPARRAMPAAGYRVPAMSGPARSLIEPLANWDGHFYSLIAAEGYRAHRITTAFWPLYPGLVALGHRFTGWSIQLVGVLLSNAALLAALCLLHRLTRLDLGPAVADRTVWLIALFPTSFYLSAVYAEGLFLLLTVASLLLARLDRWPPAGALGALAALTRPTGVLLLAPLALLVARRHGPAAGRPWRRALPLLLVPLGPLAFMVHLQVVWGDPWLTFRQQQFWARGLAWPGTTLLRFWEEQARWYVEWLGRCLTTPTGAGLACRGSDLALRTAPAADIANLLALTLVLPLTVVMLRRLPLAYGVYGLLGVLAPLIVPAQENPLLSFARHIVVVFPLFIALALVLHRRWLQVVALGLSAAGLVALLILFSAWHWIA